MPPGGGGGLYLEGQVTSLGGLGRDRSLFMWEGGVEGNHGVGQAYFL